jgi:hypothetical protein
MRICAACFCGRAYRGFIFIHPARDRPAVVCCSMACLAIAKNRSGNMNISIDEKQAVFAASEAIGAYLENIGKTDLFTMTEAEWLGFLGHTYACVSDEVRKGWSEIPF